MVSQADCVWYHSRTLGAHVLATVVGLLPNVLQFCHMRRIRPGGVTQVDHASAQLSRLEAVVVASPKSPESPDITPMASQPQTPAVYLHQWRVPQFALKYPCNRPPPPQWRDRHLATVSTPLRGRPSRAMGGDFKGGKVLKSFPYFKQTHAGFTPCNNAPFHACGQHKHSCWLCTDFFFSPKHEI